MNKLIIIVSGNEIYTRNSISNYILCSFINYRIGFHRFSVVSRGKGNYIFDKFRNIEINTEEITRLSNSYSVKQYTQEYALKEVARKLFGFEDSQLYGSKDSQSIHSHISWESMPDSIRKTHSRKRKGIPKMKLAFGNIKTCDLLEILADEILLPLDQNCLARNLLHIIEDEKYELAIINSDGNINQATLATEIGAKVIYLVSKNTPENTPFGEFHLILDTNTTKMKNCIKLIAPKVLNWFNEKCLIEKVNNG